MNKTDTSNGAKAGNTRNLMCVIIKNHLIKCFYWSKVVHLKLITVTTIRSQTKKKLNEIFCLSSFPLLSTHSSCNCYGHTYKKVTTFTSMIFSKMDTTRKVIQKCGSRPILPSKKPTNIVIITIIIMHKAYYNMFVSRPHIVPQLYGRIMAATPKIDCEWKRL